MGHVQQRMEAVILPFPKQNVRLQALSPVEEMVKVNGTATILAGCMAIGFVAAASWLTYQMCVAVLDKASKPSL